MAALQPEDTASLIAAVRQARGGAGQAINAGVQGYEQGVQTDVEKRKQALAEQVRGMSVIRPGEGAIDENGVPQINGPSTPEKYNALTAGHYKYEVGGARQGAMLAGQQRADTAAKAESDANDYHRGLLSAKQAELAAKAPAGMALTAQNKSRVQLANSLLPALDDYQNLVNKADAMGLVGPAAGRIYTTFQKVGTTGDPAKDELLNQLISEHTLLASKVGVMHYGARATADAMKGFKEMFDPSHLSPAMIKGGLDATREFAKGYSSMGQPAAPTTPQTPPIASPPAASPTSGVPTFASPAEARAANLPKGSHVKIGNQIVEVD